MASETPTTSRTRTFRLPGDLADKLTELIELLGGTSASYLDPLVRPQIENDHKANFGAISAMRDARKAREESPVLTNALETEGS